MRGAAAISRRLWAAFAVGVAGSASAAPAPGLPDGAEGWRFASCQMQSVCQGSGEGACRDLPIPGRTYLWRDALGIRLGTSASAATTIPTFANIDDATAFVADTTEATELMIISPQDQGPGWMRVGLFRATDGDVDRRSFLLVCDTFDAAPPEFQDPGLTAPPAPEEDPEVVE